MSVNIYTTSAVINEFDDFVYFLGNWVINLLRINSRESNWLAMPSINSVLSLIAAEISVAGPLAAVDVFRSCTVTWGHARGAHGFVKSTARSLHSFAVFYGVRSTTCPS